MNENLGFNVRVNYTIYQTSVSITALINFDKPKIKIKAKAHIRHRHHNYIYYFLKLL